MAIDNDSQERTIDDIQAELNAQLEDIAKQAKEDAEKRELMVAAVNDALGTTKPVTSPVTDKDDDLIMIDANPISHQNAEASGSGTNNPTDITPKDNTVITPISTEVKKTKTRTIINRSQRYRLYASVIAFATEDITEIRKSLLHLYDKFYSLTDISVRSIKRQDKSIVRFIVVEFYVESQAKKALLLQIPGTLGVYFRILNEQAQLADQVNAASSASQDDITTPGHMPGQVKIYSEFADRTAQRIDRDNRTVKIMEIPLSFDEAAVKAAFDQHGLVEFVRMTTKNSWQQAFVTFVEEKSIQPFFCRMGLYIFKILS